jgi:hypothetical protein
MTRVFISYASRDCQQVSEALARMIEKGAGCQVWLDRKNIVVAEEWQASLSIGLEAADWFLVLVSRGAVHSPSVRSETEWAIEHLPNRIIPVVVDGTDPAKIDSRLAKIQHHDLRREKRRTQERVVKMLRDSRAARFGRGIVGKWISAVQPVYYQRPKWHVQDVQISQSSGNYMVKTVPAPKKLQWRMDATLIAESFLTGPWRSTREGSQSHGYMTLQVSRSGAYMCGHDYAVAIDEARAHLGVMLLGRTSADLRRAWEAICAARRELLPLKKRCDF